MASREFIDEQQRHWTVWDVRPSLAERRRGSPDARPEPRPNRRARTEGVHFAVGTRHATGWLVFETSGERRRLAPIPAGWVERSETELALLCESATRARSPHRLLG